MVTHCHVRETSGKHCCGENTGGFVTIPTAEETECSCNPYIPDYAKIFRLISSPCI